VARTLVERYEDDLYLIKGTAGWAGVLLLLAALAALPFLLPKIGFGYLLFIAILLAGSSWLGWGCHGTSRGPAPR
jgi:hypothetical protein